MAEQEPNKKPSEVDEEIENLLREVQDPLPVGDVPKPPVPVEAQPVSEIPNEEPKEEPKEESIDNDIKLILGKFHRVTEKIIHNYDCDRDEIGDAVERLRDMLISSNKPPEHVVAGYVAALKTKTDANTNIIKLLDAFAKIISSTKNTNIISQSASIDLSGYLNNEDDDDDE